MFNHKKFLAALLCTPLFTACVVNGDDSDDSNDTGTDPTNATLTTSAGTGDESSGTLTTTVGTEESESGSESVDSGSSDEGSTGDTAGDGMFCQQACEEAADCCTEGDKACAADPAAYPNGWSCDAGACTSNGCSEDTECDAVIPGYVCSVVDGYGFCEQPCETAEDCTLPGLEECLDDGEGGLTCQPGPCVDDADCFEGYVCEADGVCTYGGCGADEDCFGGGTCDTTSGVCSCAEATDCDKGFACAG